jgi:hypothetical protein
VSSLHAELVDASNMLAVVVAVVTFVWAWRGDMIIQATTFVHAKQEGDHATMRRLLGATLPAITLAAVTSVLAAPILANGSLRLWQLSGNCPMHFCWETMDLAASLFFLTASVMLPLAGLSGALLLRLGYRAWVERTHDA